jgi:hypothetical protein
VKNSIKIYPQFSVKIIEHDAHLRKQPHENDKEENCMDTACADGDQPVWLRYQEQSLKR